MIINFVFIRHGESCQQLVSQIKDSKKRHELFNKYTDPTLSDTGVQNSILAGRELKKTLNKDFGIKSFDIIGCSPMLRAIETVHYMTKESPTKYNKPIFVFPFLRESKEGDTIKKLDASWPMKSIEEQKEYLKTEGIDNISFYYVRNLLARSQPGNIENFIKWLSSNLELPDKPIVNILLVLHSHVIMNAFNKNGVSNNAGFIMSAKMDTKGSIVYDKKNIKAVWPSTLHKRLKCPSVKCPNICEAINDSIENNLENLRLN
jgi:broad specificity phosphatase PhoE